MPNSSSIPIDWASVDWLYVAVLAVLVFVSALIGTLLSFRRAFLGAVLTAVVFAAAFVFWTYYPHGLPLPTSFTAQKAPVMQRGAAAPPVQAAPSAPEKPANPVTTLPPSSPPGSSQ